MPLETDLGFVPLTPMGKFLVPMYIEDWKKALEGMRDHLHSAVKDKSVPRHVRTLALWAAARAQTLMSDVDSGRFELSETIAAALEVGMFYQRFLLWEYERPAGAGKRSRAAAQRKGRRAPSGSVREFLERLKGSRVMSNGRLLLQTQKNFPNRTQANLKRQIRRFKKSGQ